MGLTSFGRGLRINEVYRMMGGPGGFNRPVEEGKEYEVSIDAQGSKGDGIAHLEGFVIFVAGAHIGQTVKVRITSLRRTFAIGEIIQ